MANFITILRAILSFVAVSILFQNTPGTYWAAFILTILVIWMDGLDGYVARKFNETSKFGAVLDILSDRVVENVYWVSFAVLSWLPLWVPLVVLTRGIITDGLRGLALEQGYTAFGEKTMMQSKIGKFIVASNFSRFSYAVLKAMAFALLILANVVPAVTSVAYICAYGAVFFCIVRGLPVMIESRRFLTK